MWNSSEGLFSVCAHQMHAQENPHRMDCDITCAWRLIDLPVQLDQFESLNIMPAGPGQPGLSPAQLPRPLGDEIENMVEAPPLAHPSNCPARYMRVTVSAIPSQQVQSPLNQALKKTTHLSIAGGYKSSYWSCIWGEHPIWECQFCIRNGDVEIYLYLHCAALAHCHSDKLG